MVGSVGMWQTTEIRIVREVMSDEWWVSKKLVDHMPAKFDERTPESDAGAAFVASKRRENVREGFCVPMIPSSGMHTQANKESEYCVQWTMIE